MITQKKRLIFKPIKSNDNTNSSFIILNSKNDNKIIAVAESGRLTKNRKYSYSDLILQLKDKFLMINPSLVDTENKNKEEKIIADDDSIIKYSINKREKNFNEGDGKLFITSLYQCPINCKKCSNSKSCTECDDHYSFDIIENKCILQCPPGMYSMNGMCFTCPLTCNGSKEILRQCPNCTHHRHIDVNCPTGQYSCGFMWMSCCPCPSLCTDCKTSGSSPTCTSCKEHGHTSGNDCVADEGYYSDGSSFSPCYSNCKNCNGGGENQCTECPSGQSLSGGKCVCPNGQYADAKICRSWWQ